MFIPIPAIDIIDGRCVRLTRGDYDTQKVYDADPVELARRVEGLGFVRLHLVDLDGAKSHHVVNYKTLERIATATSLIVDFGGGIKSEEDLHIVLDSGAQMVTLGSIAVTEPQTFASWLARYGSERIILGADAREGKISINGWKEGSDESLMPFLRRHIEDGVRHVLCTDISRDGMLQGPATPLYSQIMQEFPECRLIASGGVGSLADLIDLAEAGIPAAVFGKALYEGHITLEEISKEFLC